MAMCTALQCSDSDNSGQDIGSYFEKFLTTSMQLYYELISSKLSTESLQGT